MLSLLGGGDLLCKKTVSESGGRRSLDEGIGTYFVFAEGIDCSIIVANCQCSGRWTPLHAFDSQAYVHVTPTIRNSLVQMPVRSIDQRLVTTARSISYG